MQPAAGGIRFQRLNDDGTPIPADTEDGWAALCVKNCTINFNINPNSLSISITTATFWKM
jgi:hypothetical protein